MACSEQVALSEQAACLNQLAVATVVQCAQVMPEAVQHCSSTLELTLRHGHPKTLFGFPRN